MFLLYELTKIHAHVFVICTVFINKRKYLKDNFLTVAKCFLVIDFLYASMLFTNLCILTSQTDVFCSQLFVAKDSLSLSLSSFSLSQKSNYFCLSVILCFY